MKKDKIKIYVLEILFVIFLFFTLFAPNIFNRVLVAIIMLVLAVILSKTLKNNKIKSIYDKQIIIWMTIFSLVYLGIFYLMGLHFGFRYSKIIFSVDTCLRFIIPLMVIIISSEVVRKILLMQNGNIRIKNRHIDLSKILTYVIMILIDLVIYNGIYNLNQLDDFLIALGFVFFASISCNLLYNYISVRYGEVSIIIYRLITILYVYIIPIVPDVYIFFQSFLRMVYPYIIYVILDRIYSKTDFTISYVDRRKMFFRNTILLSIMVLFIMLISCQFRYGILVIGSGSMTGTINKGDAVIYEKYQSDAEVLKGQVIIFDYNGVKTIHRVDDIKRINGVNRYFTKGDANKDRDDGYITDDKIYGLVKLRVKYIGYPTLWVRSLFS